MHRPVLQSRINIFIAALRSVGNKITVGNVARITIGNYQVFPAVIVKICQ